MLATVALAACSHNTNSGAEATSSTVLTSSTTVVTIDPQLPGRLPKPVVLSATGVGGVAFGRAASPAEAVLVASLGPSVSDTGWAADKCAEERVRTLRWGALEIRFADDGTGARLDGWLLARASGERPAAVRVSPDIGFETTWPRLQSLGAVWEEGYDRWSIAGRSLLGRLSTASPSRSSTVTAIGGGATNLLGC